jgi:hypothetical protein
MMSIKQSLQRLGVTFGLRMGVLGVLMSAECAVLIALTLATATPASAQFFPFFGSPEPRPQPQRQAPAPRPRSQGLFPWFNAPQEQPQQEQQRRAPSTAQRGERGDGDASKAPPPKKADSDTAPTSTIVVFGDSMADWLSYGLEDAFSETPEVGIVRKVRAYSGLLRYAGRSDQDWAQVARENLTELKPSVVVIMVGLGDRSPIRSAEPNAQGRPANRSIEFRGDHWDEAYGKKVDEMIAVLKSKGVPVIWVGVPSVRGTRSTSDFSYLNDIFRQHAEKAGITFVDVWDGFVDEAGRFIYQGPDVDGQTRRLRTGDGVHFTQFGARKLAHYVEREIRRLISTSRQTPTLVSKGDDAAAPAPYSLQNGNAPDVVRARPIAGPVLPLTATSGGGDELLGAGSARPAAGNTLASRVLIRGEAISPPKGRADDFGWHGPDASVPVASAPGNAQRDAAIAPAEPEKTASVPDESADNATPDKPSRARGTQTPANETPARKPSRRANADERVRPDPQPAPRRTVRAPPPERPVEHRAPDFFDIFR